ncbi:MAG: hypothetical protein JRF35_15755 [Deltaproteobacteria bacterium]|nr:hypothetical protein [Deltaproteobacteria bacterium]
METFTQLKDFVLNPQYHSQREKCVRTLDMNTIDAPLIEILKGFLALPYCFTLQCCYGHFLHGEQRNPQNLEPLPISDSTSEVEYRIAYLALCIQDNDSGKGLFNELNEIPDIDPAYIQFGCAEWFWEQQVNSYALQVEPERHKNKDSVFIGYQEARHIQKIRDEFFGQLKRLIEKGVIR